MRAVCRDAHLLRRGWKAICDIESTPVPAALRAHEILVAVSSWFLVRFCVCSEPMLAMIGVSRSEWRRYAEPLSWEAVFCAAEGVGGYPNYFHAYSDRRFCRACDCAIHVMTMWSPAGRVLKVSIEHCGVKERRLIFPDRHVTIEDVDVSCGFGAYDDSVPEYDDTVPEWR